MEENWRTKQFVQQKQSKEDFRVSGEGEAGGSKSIFQVSVKYISGDYLGTAAALQDWEVCHKKLTGYCFAMLGWRSHLCNISTILG